MFNLIDVSKNLNFRNYIGILIQLKTKFTLSTISWLNCWFIYFFQTQQHVVFMVLLDIHDKIMNPGPLKKHFVLYFCFQLLILKWCDLPLTHLLPLRKTSLAVILALNILPTSPNYSVLCALSFSWNVTQQVATQAFCVRLLAIFILLEHFAGQRHFIHIYALEVVSQNYISPTFLQLA